MDVRWLGFLMIQAIHLILLLLQEIALKGAEIFGYALFLKPVKLYEQEDGSTRRKANCDVEMAYCLMKEHENYNRVVILSGDGDFLPVLKHLREIEKEVIILARGPRTAKEIRQFAGSNFRDFEYLRESLKMP